MPTDKDNEFHERRATGIGGSDAAAVAGLDPWQSAYELYLRKRGELAPIEETEPMRWGKILEPVIALEYATRTGRGIVRPKEMLRSERYPWMIGHIDRMVDLGERILEIKTSRLPIGWGESGTDAIPLNYAAQCHHYMTVAEVQFCDVAVLIGGNDLRIYTIEADVSIASTLIEAERVFWENVQSGTPPEVVNARDAVRRWGKLDAPGRVVAGDDEFAAVEELRSLRERKSQIAEREEVARAVILKALSDKGDTLIDRDGNVLATWKLDGGRKAYSVAAREPARRFLLKDWMGQV